MEQITINLLATGVTPVCHVSQFDDGRTVRINLKKGAEVYALSGTETIKMRIRKPDDTERVVDIVNTSSSYVDYVSVPEDCDIEGVNVCELVIDELGSKNFLMNVEEDAYGGGADIETLTASGLVATFETNMVDNLVDLKAEITPIQDLHGYDYPWTAGGGKNLLKTSGLSLIPPSNTAFSNATKRTFSLDSYCLGLSHNNYYQPSKITSYSISENSVVMNSSAQAYGIGIPMTLEVGVQYNLSFVTTGGRIATAFYGSDGTALAFIDNTTDNYHFTVPEDTAYVVFVFKVTTNDVEATFSNIQVEKGSTATDYAPYENVCPITGHAEVKIKHTGKNLYDKSVESMVGYIGSSSFSTSSTKSRSFYIPIVGGLSYTIQKMVSARFCVATSPYIPTNGEVFTNRVQNNTRSSLTITAGANDKYLWVFFYLYDTDTETESVIKDTIQIEIGSDATDYEPYTGAEVTVQFGQTVYKGVLDAKNSKVILTFVLVDLGSLTWGHSISDTRNFFYTTRAFEVAPKGVAQGRTNDDKSSEYRNAQYSEVVNGTALSSFNIPNTTKRLYLYDALKTNMTAEEFTAAVAGVQLLYEIETPIEIPLSSISQFETLLGINNVYANTGDVELKYLKQV